MPKITKRKRGLFKRRKGGGGQDPLVRKWNSRILLAESKMRKCGGDPKDGGGWRNLIELFEGKHWRAGEGGGKRTFHRITSNLVKSNIDALRPQLYFHNPKTKIQIKNPELATQPIPTIDGRLIPAGTPVASVGGQIVDAAEQVELIETIDNYYLEEMGAKKVLKRGINDALVLPYAVFKLEWEITTEERTVVLDTDLETGEPTETDTEEVVVSQKPTLTRIKPWHFLWDEDLDEFDLSLARWVAQISFLTMEDLKAIPGIKNLKDLPQAGFSTMDTSDIPDGVNEEEFRKHKVYEIHDLKAEKRLIWVDGSDQFQLEEENPYAGVEGSIFTVLGFDETIDSAFPLPLPAQIESKVKGRNWILSYMLSHVGRFNRKYKVRRDSMTPDQKELLETGGDGTIVEVEDMQGGPDPISDAPVSVDMYNVESILKREITEEFGMSAFNRASREPGVETASEARQIQAGSDVKTEEKRDQVRECMKSIVKKLNQILKLFFTGEQAIKIAGTRGERWVSWSREDIEGEFLTDVDIYSAMPFSIQQDRRQALEMFSLTQQDPYFNPLEVRHELRRRMGWNEKVLFTPGELQQAQGQITPQIAAQLDQSRAGQSQQIRPGPGRGAAQRQPDILASLLGGATRGA